jgi:hypothetical protein
VHQEARPKLYDCGKRIDIDCQLLDTCSHSLAPRNILIESQQMHLHSDSCMSRADARKRSPNAPHKHPNEEEGGWSVTSPEAALHVKFTAEEHNARFVSRSSQIPGIKSHSIKNIASQPSLQRSAQGKSGFNSVVGGLKLNLDLHSEKILVQD